jgi:hypothetical protein
MAATASIPLPLADTGAELEDEEDTSVLESAADGVASLEGSPNGRSQESR